MQLLSNIGAFCVFNGYSSIVLYLRLADLESTILLQVHLRSCI